MKKVFMLLFVIGLLIALTTMGPSTASAAKKSKAVTIRFAHDLPPVLPPVIGLHWWAKEVTKQTEGRVKVQMFPAGSLSTSASNLQNIRSGVIDMCWLSMSIHRKSLPICSLASLPGAGFPDETIEDNTAHMNTFFEMLRRFPAAAEEFSEFAGPLFYVIYPQAYMISKGKKIRVPDDVKGKKVGSSGGRMELMAKLRATPIMDLPPLAYEKLQTGVTQASILATSAIHDFQLFEVTDHVLDVPFGGAGFAIIVNKNTWNKISPGDQQIMKDLGPQGAKRSNVALADLTSSSWKELEEKGMKVKATPEERKLWEESFEVQWEEWISMNEAAGVKDARDIFNFWKSAADKQWAK